VQDHRHHREQSRRGPVHRAPTRHLGHETRRRARQQDANEETRHDARDNPTTLRGPGQVGREWNQYLAADGRESNHERHGGEERERRQRRGDAHRDRGECEDADGEASSRPNVAEGNDEGETQRVTGLNEGHQQGRARRADVEVLGDLVQQRLQVVEVGDDDANRDRHQRNEGAGKWFFGFDALPTPLKTLFEVSGLSQKVRRYDVARGGMEYVT
jgi:hypothetical protein